MLQLLVTGFVHPITAASFGLVWVLGRAVYNYGYATGGPNGRHIGTAISYVGDLPLLALTVKLAFNLIVKDLK